MDGHHLNAPQKDLYLVEVVHLLSRHAPSWKFSNCLGTELWLDALEMALTHGLEQEVCHSDQRSQFTSADFVATLKTEES